MNTDLTDHQMPIQHFHNEDDNFLILYNIFKDTIKPDLVYETFVELYVSESLVGIDFTLFISGTERVGFSAAFFYSTTIHGKPAFIARAATGLVEKIQGHGLHNSFDLYAKFIRFKLMHFWAPLVVTPFICNPLVFRNLCRFVPEFYPRLGKPTP